MQLDPKTLREGDPCNWPNQRERLVFIGKRRYPGDPRPWYQFAKDEDLTHVWCEILESEVSMLEKTE